MKAKRTWSTRILQLVMGIIALIYLVPIYFTLNYAFKNTADVPTSVITPPKSLFFGNFIDAMKAIEYFQTLSNTFIITFFSVASLIIVSSMAAFVIARRKHFFYKGSFLLFVCGILIPYQVIFVPLYVVGKNLGFVNHLSGVIFLYVATSLPFGIFLLTGFMKSIPIELEEAARIDGCGPFKTLGFIILPLLRPAAATLAILKSFEIWNDFLLPQLFLHKNHLQTLTVKQYQFFQQYSNNYNLAFAAIIISTLPLVIFFILMQKNFIKGIAAGAVKG